MKQCPRCRRTYEDDQLNFCLDDGELLTGFSSGQRTGAYTEDAPPTILLDQSRATNPATWPASPPPVAQWQPQPQNVAGRQFAPPRFMQSRDQTIPTLALILGILSVPLICCYGGIWLGLPAAGFGFLGLRNADSEPNRFGGRGMAMSGMVLGVVSFLASLAWALFMIVAR